MNTTVNKFMYEGRWLDRDAYRIAKGLDKPKTPPKDVVSTETVVAKKKVTERVSNKKFLEEQLKEAGENLEEYKAVLPEEDEEPKYTGKKKPEDMDFFEMKEALREAGIEFDKRTTKAKAYELLTK